MPPNESYLFKLSFPFQLCSLPFFRRQVGIGVWVRIEHAALLPNCVLHSPVVSGSVFPHQFQFFIDAPKIQMSNSLFKFSNIFSNSLSTTTILETRQSKQVKTSAGWHRRRKLKFPATIWGREIFIAKLDAERFFREHEVAPFGWVNTLVKLLQYSVTAWHW